MSCYSCDHNDAATLPSREQVWDDGSTWRLALAFDSSLPGWMCLVPRRHVQGLHELSDAEAATMGRVLRAASVALVAVTGCAKTYVMLFAEKEGFDHLHLHVVPRPVDLDPSLRGPAVFGLLGTDGVPSIRDQDGLAATLQPEVTAALRSVAPG